MSLHDTGRQKAASGGATLRYYDRKFHKKFIRNAKSSLERQFNDQTSHLKLKQSIEGTLQTEMRQKESEINEKNLKLLVKLSTVKPKVPMVIKRSFQIKEPSSVMNSKSPGSAVAPSTNN